MRQLPRDKDLIFLLNKKGINQHAEKVPQVFQCFLRDQENVMFGKKNPGNNLSSKVKGRPKKF